MHFIFIDFETQLLKNNYFGKLIEFCAIDEQNNVILNKKFNDKTIKDNKENIENCFKKILDYCKLKFNDEKVYFIFWHNWMIQYISKKSFNIIQNTLKNRYLILCNIVFFEKLKENEPYIYLSEVRIENVTMLLAGRTHKGNALSDCIDLKECFEKTIKRD